MDERFSDAPESSVRNSTHAVWSEYQESPTADNTIDQHYKRTGTRKSGRRATVSSSSSKKMSRQTPRVSSDGRKFVRIIMLR